MALSVRFIYFYFFLFALQQRGNSGEIKNAHHHLQLVLLFAPTINLGADRPDGDVSQIGWICFTLYIRLEEKQTPTHCQPGISVIGFIGGAAQSGAIWVLFLFLFFYGHLPVYAQCLLSAPGATLDVHLWLVAGCSTSPCCTKTLMSCVSRIAQILKLKNRSRKPLSFAKPLKCHGKLLTLSRGRSDVFQMCRYLRYMAKV